MTRIVTLGVTVKPGSSTELALTVSTEPARDSGAGVEMFHSAYLAGLQHAGLGHSLTAGRQLIEAVRIIITTPASHGTISGVVKNALDS